VREQWQRIFPTRHCHSLAAARKSGKTCGSETASSLLLFLAGSDLQQTKKRTQQLILLCFLFSDLFPPVGCLQFLYL
jgi:hypothetical protein